MPFTIVGIEYRFFLSTTVLFWNAFVTLLFHSSTVYEVCIMLLDGSCRQISNLNPWYHNFLYMNLGFLIFSCFIWRPLYNDFPVSVVTLFNLRSALPFVQFYLISILIYIFFYSECNNIETWFVIYGQYIF